MMTTHVRFATRRSVVLVAAIVLVTLLAYANSVRGVFVLDDRGSILENASIRQIASAFHPPASGTTVAGRPVLNVSFAMNYRLGETDPWGYHAVNLLIHLAAALALFGLIRRTLVQPVFGGRFVVHADLLAAAAAALWAVHPLQTESVTYVVQRAESLAGLFFLFTLYCNVRRAAVPGIPVWKAAGWVACLLGMATKETMVSAPLLVMLYDATFVFGSIRSAWNDRRRWYAALGSTWVLLAWLVWQTKGRGGSVGFGPDIEWWPYALTQVHALAQYGGLAVWPTPLVFDYGFGVIRSFALIVGPAVAIAIVASAWIVGSRRNRPLWYLGVAAFAVLAPTTFVPVATQTMAEHRMYLPLAGVIAAGVVGAYELISSRIFAVALAAVVALAVATRARNEVYRTDIGLWADTVAKTGQGNARARFNFGLLLSQSGHAREAVEQYQAAVRISPDYFEAQTNLGTSLVLLNRAEEALAPLRAAVRLKPQLAPPHGNLAHALIATGQLTEAKLEYEAALRLQPDDAELHVGLGRVLAGLRDPAAVGEWEQALRLDPDNMRAHQSLAAQWQAAGRLNEALVHLRRLVELQPNNAEAQGNLGTILLQLGQTEEALNHFRAAVAAAPHAFVTQYNLGNALLAARRYEEAIAAYRTTARLNPHFADAHVNCAVAFGKLERWSEALAEYEEAARLDPNDAPLREAIRRLRSAHDSTTR